MKKLFAVFLLLVLPATWISAHTLMVVVGARNRSYDTPLSPQGDDMASYILYVPEMTVPTTNYPAGFSAWTLDSNTNVPSGDVPEIAEWTRQDDPGDTMALTAEGIATGLVHFVFNDGTANAYSGLIQRLDGRQAAVTLPTNLPPDEMYLMWAYNTNGFGEPVAINQTEEWWVGPDVTWTGETFSVFGQNLTLDGTSYLYIDDYGWLSTTNCNPYKADFVVPSDLATGTYTVHAHNGHGGDYGWDSSSSGLSFTVRSEIAWSDNTSTWYNVKSYGAVGDGVTDDTSAILSAIAATGHGTTYDTIYFPAGTYLTTSRIDPGYSLLRYKGDGMDVSTIQGSSDSWSGANYMLILAGNSSVEDMTIRMGDIANVPLQLKGGTEWNKNCRLLRSKFSCLSPNDVTDGAQCMDISTGDYLVAEDCVFEVDWGISAGIGTQFIFKDCEFVSMGDCNGLVSFSGSESAFIDCYAHPYNAADTTDRIGWGKGRWIYGGGPINKIYLGGNVSSNMAPRYPAAEFWGTATNVTGDSVAYGTNYFWFADNGSLTGSLSTVDLPAELVADMGNDNWGGFTILSIDTTNLMVKVKRTWYAGTFPTNNYCVIKETVDQNSGEQFLWEGMNAWFRGKPMAVSNATTLVFDDLPDESGSTFAIVEGRGAGQMRKIASKNTSTGVVVLNEPLRVLPDANSLCKIGRFLDRVVCYDNNLNGTDRATEAGVYTATAGFNCYGGASRLIIDGNRFGRMKTGVTLWANSDEGIYRIIQPNLFNVVKDNRIDTCQVGIAHILQDWGREVEGDTTFYGHVMRRNIVTNSTVNAFSESTCWGRMRKDMCIFDQNVFAANAAFVSSSSSNLYNQVWRNNAVVQDGGNGLAISSEDSYVLQGNTWSGFDTNYTGTLAGVLELPVRVGFTGAGKTFAVYNSGTSNLTVTANGKTKTIPAESSTNFTYTATAATSYPVTGGGQTNTFYVVEDALGDE